MGFFLDFLPLSLSRVSPAITRVMSHASVHPVLSHTGLTASQRLLAPRRYLML